MFIVPLSTLPAITPIKPMETGANPVENGQKSGFGSIFEEALTNARETQKVADEDSMKVALGQTDNLAQVMINSAKASTATQMAVELTARAVSSYKEIMQMQV